MLLAANEANRKLAGLPHGTLRGVITSIDDPLNRGRVQVIFDDMNPDIPQITGAGEISGRRVGEEPNASHWIDVCPAFSGKQPPGLVGKRVNITPSNGQYQYSVLQDVLFDPDIHATDAKQPPVMPNNSSMTRLPIYPAGSLPPASSENHGCTVIEEGGPMNSDWVCVCLKRNGKFIWVRHADLAHGHAGSNDTTQQVDSSGNRPSPAQAAASWDHVFVTSHQEMEKNTGFGTAPRGNPWGGAAAWSPPPMSDIKPLPTKPGTLFDQTTALGQARSTGFTGDVAGSFITNYAPAISAAAASLPDFNVAGDAIKQAQDALAKAQALGQKIPNLTDFVSEVAGSTLGGNIDLSSVGTTASQALGTAVSLASQAQSIISNPTAALTSLAVKAASKYIPQATQIVLSSITNPQAVITNVLSSLPAAPKLL